MRRGARATAPVLLAVACVALCLSNAQAWYRGGHELTSAVAQQRMTPEALRIARDYLGTTRHIEPNLLALPSATKLPLNATTITQAAYWPDAIRPLGFSHFASWHFIDLPIVRLAGTNRSSVFPTEPSPINNVLWAATLGAELLRDKEASAALKSAALRFVLHFVGDIHQPLHAASLFSRNFPHGDGGGNAFRVTNSSLWHNLHGLWDSAAGEFNWFDVYHHSINIDTVTAVARNLSETYAEQPQFVPGSLNLTAWVWESHALAANVAYDGIEPGTPASAEYVAKVQQTCNNRIVLGGYRLAELLNEALPLGAASDTPSGDHRRGGIRLLWFVVAVVVSGAAVTSLIVMYRSPRFRPRCLRSPADAGYGADLMADHDGGVQMQPTSVAISVSDAHLDSSHAAPGSPVRPGSPVL